CVPDGVLYLGHAAELEARLPPGLGLAHATLHQIVDAAVRVIAQLAIEIPLQPIAPPAEQIEEPVHGPRLPRRRSAGPRRSTDPSWPFRSPAACGLRA